VRALTLALALTLTLTLALNPTLTLTVTLPRYLSVYVLATFGDWIQGGYPNPDPNSNPSPNPDPSHLWRLDPGRVP